MAIDNKLFVLDTARAFPEIGCCKLRNQLCELAGEAVGFKSFRFHNL
jgi:hypothetical protein